MSSERSLDQEKEVVRLIESDHKETTDFIARLTTQRGALRGLIVSLGSALAGLALANDSWITAVAGIPIVLAGALAEARSNFLLQVAHNRSVRLEHKIQAYVARLIETGAVADDAAAKLRRELDTYQVGTSRSLRRPSLLKTLVVAIRHATFWLYPALAVALAVVAVAASSSGEQETEACLLLDSGAVIVVDKLPDVRSGELVLVPCPAP